MSEAVPFTTGLFRVVNPYLHEINKRRQSKGKTVGTDKFEVTCLFPKAELPQVMSTINAAKKAIADLWPSADAAFVTAVMHRSIRDGDKLLAAMKQQDAARGTKRAEKKLWLAGHYVIRPKSGADYPPTVYDQYGAEIAQAANVKTKVYGGSYGYANLAAKAFEGNTDSGGEIQPVVAFYLNAYMWAKDGQKIGGGGRPTTAAEAFAGLIQKPSSVDPTAGADDEDDDPIPF